MIQLTRRADEENSSSHKAWKYAWAAPLFHFVPSSIPHLSAIRYLQSTYFWAHIYFQMFKLTINSSTLTLPRTALIVLPVLLSADPWRMKRLTV